MEEDSSQRAPEAAPRTQAAEKARVTAEEDAQRAEADIGSVARRELPQTELEAYEPPCRPRPEDYGVKAIEEYVALTASLEESLRSIEARERAQAEKAKVAAEEKAAEEKAAKEAQLLASKANEETAAVGQLKKLKKL